jgi:hypothetical protein
MLLRTAIGPQAGSLSTSMQLGLWISILCDPEADRDAAGNATKASTAFMPALGFSPSETSSSTIYGSLFRITMLDDFAKQPLKHNQVIESDGVCRDLKLYITPPMPSTSQRIA